MFIILLDWNLTSSSLRSLVASWHCPVESDVAGGTPDMFSTTSFTLSTEDLQPAGGLDDRDSFLEHNLLLGGL